MHILPCNYSVKAGHFFWHCSIRISGCLILPPHYFHFLVEGVELAVPGLDVGVEAVPEAGPGGQARHAPAHLGHWVTSAEWKWEMALFQYFIRFEICWCTGHQIQSEKNSVKVKIFSNLCCPNLWGGSPVLLQFSPWNHLVDLKENKLIIWLTRAIMKFPICPFISFREGMPLSLKSLYCVWSRFSFLVREWKNVTDYCDYCDFVWVGAVGNIANPSPAPASYPII